VTEFLNRQGDQPSKPQAIKENVVEGVLQNYLDQLLVTATQPQRVEKAIHIPDIDDQDAVKLEEKIEADVVVPAIETEVVKVERISIATVAVQPKTDSLVESASNNIAESISTEIESAIKQSMLKLTDQESWSSQGVECLLFSVGGLKLAVPLLLLGGVHEVIPDNVKPLIGQPNWYLGLIHREDQNLQVIDTASFIMPERAESLAEQGYKYLIQLEKSPWAIACQSIDDTVRLEASEIKWRGDRGKRVWLAGTVIEKMCALIDVSGLLQRVESSCKPV
tara:strand:- start:453 stop:1289 length:837 start_codon:yes stop_codon:yes gene_type:complete